MYCLCLCSSNSSSTSCAQVTKFACFSQPLVKLGKPFSLKELGDPVVSLLYQLISGCSLRTCVGVKGFVESAAQLLLQTVIACSLRAGLCLQANKVPLGPGEARQHTHTHN